LCAQQPLLARFFLFPIIVTSMNFKKNPNAHVSIQAVAAAQKFPLRTGPCYPLQSRNERFFSSLAGKTDRPMLSLQPEKVRFGMSIFQSDKLTP
jgi:hypothetical protein